MRWKLTVRAGPRVRRQAFPELEGALAALEHRGRELADSAAASDQGFDAKIRKFEPVERVFARLEIAGPERLVPSVRVGVDVRGDGSVEAYRGRVKRQLIEPRSGESSYAALRRELAAQSSA